MSLQRNTLKIFEGLPDELKAAVLQLLEPVYLQKNDIFIGQGVHTDKIGFVVSGIVYGYVLKDGEEKTLHISSTYNSIAAYDCLLLNEPSRITYKALTDAQLMVTSFSALQALYKAYPLADQLGKEFIRLQLADAYQRTASFIVYTPLERYRQLQQETPELIHHVPQKVLASYLGITPVSLSRIRKRARS